MSRRNVCLMIEEIKGNKSTKLMELINRKLQAEKESKLEKYIIDKKLNILVNKYKEAKENHKLSKKALQDRESELDLEWNTYNGEEGYKIKERCRISKEDFIILQKAQDLSSIGKREEAKTIWTSTIKKHKLFK